MYCFRMMISLKKDNDAFVSLIRNMSEDVINGCEYIVMSLEWDREDDISVIGVFEDRINICKIKFIEK